MTDYNFGVFAYKWKDNTVTSYWMGSASNVLRGCGIGGVEFDYKSTIDRIVDVTLTDYVRLNTRFKKLKREDSGRIKNCKLDELRDSVFKNLSGNGDIQVILFDDRTNEFFTGLVKSTEPMVRLPIS